MILEKSPFGGSNFVETSFWRGQFSEKIRLEGESVKAFGESVFEELWECIEVVCRG